MTKQSSAGEQRGEEEWCPVCGGSLFNHSGLRPCESKPEQREPLKPSVTLLVKLGSIIVHADELVSPNGHHFDGVALQQLLEDEEVKTWITAMDKMAFLPKKR